METLLTPKQLSELLQVKLRTVYFWAHTGFIPCVRLGKCLRFVESEVLVWINKRRNEGRSRLKLTI